MYHTTSLVAGCGLRAGRQGRKKALSTLINNSDSSSEYLSTY